MTLKVPLLLLFAVPTGAAGGQSGSHVADTGWAVQAIDSVPARNGDSFGRVVRFVNGQRMTVLLTDVEVLGRLASSPRPWLVLTGRECASCDAEVRVYIFPVDTGLVDPRRSWFRFPGTARAGGEPPSSVYYRGRFFLGRCTGADDEAVWVESERSRTGPWHKSAYRVRVLGGKLTRGSVSLRAALARIQRSVRSGLCAEVPGRDQGTF